MKTHHFNVLICALALLVFCCKVEEAQKDQPVTDKKEVEVAEVSREVPSAICIWKEIAIRDTPSEKGKYLTSVYLGEKLEVLQDTASEKVKDRRIAFQKVKLIDGTEGWIRTDFIAINAVAAAVLADAVIYKRPDLMTSTKKNFTSMDFVAIKTKNDDGWSEVVGKRSGDTWFTTAWVRSEHLSTIPQDVMVSVLYTKAMDIKDEVEREEEIKKILANTDMLGSNLYTLLNEKYGAPAETSEEDDSGEVIEEEEDQSESEDGN